MDIDIQKFKAVAAIAKSRTSDRRWQAAIDKAVAGVESGWWVITELASSVAVTTESGKTYFANGVCQCEAFKQGRACKHRALYRLLALYNEAEKETAGAVSAHDLRACERLNCDECDRIIGEQVERDIAEYEARKAPPAVSPAAERQSDKPTATAATRRAPRVTRSVERDHAGNRFAVVRCEGWMI